MTSGFSELALLLNEGNASRLDRGHAVREAAAAARMQALSELSKRGVVYSGDYGRNRACRIRPGERVLKAQPLRG